MPSSLVQKRPTPEYSECKRWMADMIRSIGTPRAIIRSANPDGIWPGSVSWAASARSQSRIARAWGSSVGSSPKTSRPLASAVEHGLTYRSEEGIMLISLAASVQAAAADHKLAPGAARARVIAAGLIGLEGRRDGLGWGHGVGR